MALIGLDLYVINKLKFSRVNSPSASADGSMPSRNYVEWSLPTKSQAYSTKKHMTVLVTLNPIISPGLSLIYGINSQNFRKP